jgi:ribonuclease VapC
MKEYVLDANAVYRFLIDGPGAEIVERLFREAQREGTDLKMSAVNWGETYYGIARQSGYADAEEAGRRLENLPLLIVEADRVQAEFAGRIKAGYGLPYADCFAAALAGKAGTVVTADVKDFKKVPWVKTLALPAGKSS